MTSRRTLVLGGASSGKSAWAERLVTSFGNPRTYIATAQAFDAEMEAKIAAHRATRGDGWTTIDAPDGLTAAIKNCPPRRAILVDCATMWLSNRLLAEGDLPSEIDALVQAFANCTNQIVIVSNETGMSIVPDSALGRRFRDLQGKLNQRIADKADLVVTVMAGLPLALKGTLPELPA